MYVRIQNKRTNIGKKYLEYMYITNVNNKNMYATWFTKYKGISCGIFLYIRFI